MLEMASLTVPIIVFIIGEAMSGGAMAMGISDHTAMLSKSIYAVISPEGCSGILWKDKAHVQHAAHAMGVTAHCAQAHGFVDEILEEPDFSLPGSTDRIIKQVHAHLDKVLSALWPLSSEALMSRREKRFCACLSVWIRRWILHVVYV